MNILKRIRERYVWYRLWKDIRSLAEYPDKLTVRKMDELLADRASPELRTTFISIVFAVRAGTLTEADLKRLFKAIPTKIDGRTNEDGRAMLHVAHNIANLHPAPKKKQ